MLNNSVEDFNERITPCWFSFGTTQTKLKNNLNIHHDGSLPSIELPWRCCTGVDILKRKNEVGKFFVVIYHRCGILKKETCPFCSTGQFHLLIPAWLGRFSTYPGQGFSHREISCWHFGIPDYPLFFIPIASIGLHLKNYCTSTLTMHALWKGFPYSYSSVRRDKAKSSHVETQAPATGHTFFFSF